MPKHHIFAMPFAKVYPLYVQKAEGKNRTRKEVDQIICWLTGYDQAGLRQQIKQEVDIETFFARAPAMSVLKTKGPLSAEFLRIIPPR